MAPVSTELRLIQGCGYLPPREGARPGFGVPLEADVDPTVCPGYSTSLPEVVETVRYRPSYLKGYLTEHLGCTPSPAIIDAENILEGAVNMFQAFDTERKRKEAEAKRG